MKLVRGKRLDRMPYDRVNSVAQIRVVVAMVVVALVVVAMVVAPLPPSLAKADGYITGADDLPLMPGLAEVPGSTVVFDKPGGRIVEAQASGSVSRTQVAAFYGSTLPQLGWVVQPEDGDILRYERDDEILAIHLGDGNGGVPQVRFSISPKPNGQ